MRCTVFLFILFSNVCLLAGTYQDEAGNRCSLKTRDGTDHPFDGHLAPNSSRQNIDLTNADFTRGWRQIRESSTKQAEQALASQHQLLRRLLNQIRHIEAQKIQLKRDPRLAKLERQLENIPGSLNAPEVKEDLILQTKRQIKRYLDRLSHLDEKKKTLIRKIQQLKRSLTAVADLRGIDLRGAEAESTNFKLALIGKANLSEAKLKNANLDAAECMEINLANADLAGASLVNTNLSDANLRNVELGAAQLKDANLSRANLRGAGVYAADFTGANLSGAVLRDVDGWEEAVWTHAYYQADDPPWWPEGMDAKKLNIREVSSEQKPVAKEIIK